MMLRKDRHTIFTYKYRLLFPEIKMQWTKLTKQLYLFKSRHIYKALYFVLQENPLCNNIVQARTNWTISLWEMEQINYMKSKYILNKKNCRLIPPAQLFACFINSVCRSLFSFANTTNTYFRVTMKVAAPHVTFIRSFGWLRSLLR